MAPTISSEQYEKNIFQVFFTSRYWVAQKTSMFVLVHGLIQTKYVFLFNRFGRVIGNTYILLVGW